MKKKFSIKKPSTTGLLRWVLMLVTVVVIVYFVPTEDRNHYTYEVNRPWTYSLLTAPFDIPVHLDSISKRHAIDSINSVFEPIYKVDNALVKANIAKLNERLASTPDVPLNAIEKNNLTTEISRLYSNGIVDQATFSQIKNGELPSVRYIEDNTAVSVPTTEFLSPRMAYAMLDSLFGNDDRYHRTIMATHLADLLTPNVELDTLENNRMLQEMYQRATAPIGVIQQGERIIDRGDIVTLRLATVLDTYEEIATERGGDNISTSYYPLAGQLLYIILIIGALYSYLYFFRPDYYNDSRSLLFLMMMIVAFTVVSFIVVKESFSALYIIPLVMVPVMTVIFLDTRTALFTHLTVTLLCTMVANFPLEFIYLQVIAGSVGINSIKELSRRSQLVKTALYVFIAYTVAYVAIEVMQTGTIERLSTRLIGYFAINSVLISFAYILVFLIEKLFGFTSRVTLVELSDTNNKLLRELSEQCPGTFNHSMAVANLAAAAAQKIGGNELLIRAGALYHDIGKIKNPGFFTENQYGVSPHNGLDPQVSARIITSHVTDGLEMAEKAQLPEAIKKFIREHHGAGRAKYFYNTYCNAHPDEDVDPTPFTYAGVNPRSRETSLLMMADAVEAASRSLSNYSPEAIQSLVNKIIDGQIADGLHNDSPISFHDIKIIKEVFADRLKTMYHTRISYPDLKKPAGK
ncbi:MAG: HDIG domain-containing protein [Muribaculaceae bacterium]|nr:HDIG domain-containing protein [Muribaculaceae bacterium]